MVNKWRLGVLTEETGVRMSYNGRSGQGVFGVD